MKPTKLSLAQATPLPTLHTLLPLRRRDPQRPAARLYHLAWIRHRDTSCTILQKLPLYRQDAVRRTLTLYGHPGAARPAGDGRVPGLPAPGELRLPLYSAAGGRVLSGELLRRLFLPRSVIRR